MANRAPSLPLSIGILLAAAALLYVYGRPADTDVTGPAEAIDGDSLRVLGVEVRLKGLDAPELAQTCTIAGRETPCGREARAALRRLLGGGLATCVGSERDRYGRLLAECRVRGASVNAAMVRDGQAIAWGRYEAEEAEARNGYRGVWAGSFERPQDWRARHPRPPR